MRRERDAQKRDQHSFSRTLLNTSYTVKFSQKITELKAVVAFNILEMQIAQSEASSSCVLTIEGINGLVPGRTLVQVLCRA